jgi:DNA-binding NarL/FixJ family response regulator
MPGAFGERLFYTEPEDEGSYQLVNEVKWMRVLLADDQPKVRSALRLLLGQQPDLEVVGEAAEAESLLVQVKELCPDLVLLDWELPGFAADDLLPALREICPRVTVIALSGRPEARRAALAAGADAFVSKGDPPERLLAAVRGMRMDDRR